jgi:deoxycytidylate deaminase
MKQSDYSAGHKAVAGELPQPAGSAIPHAETKTRFAIGFTGAFGSGCTTGAKHLRDERGFSYVRLSESIREQWKADHPNGEEPSRVDLQRLGDRMRADGGPGVLVAKAIQAWEKQESVRVVIDGIRNVGEVKALEDYFGYRFVLMAVLANTQDRWDRIGQAYTDTSRTQLDFLQDDERDRNEEIENGQQVELCVDRSDVFIDNSVGVNPGAFKSKVLEYADLVTGVKPRSARSDEILMNVAYGASHSSKCMKRHVGAVVADEQGKMIVVGYNENPLGTHPCIEEPEYDYRCYRDIVRNEHFANLAKRSTKCPTCGDPIGEISGPPWRCNSCAQKNVKTNLETIFFPDRALNWCTAIHAEVWALLAAGDRARGGVLYTTTFPCFQCSEKIIQAGIKRVVFTEAYPDVKGELRLKLGRVELRKFEGVRSSSFQRIFDCVTPR